MRRGPEPPDFSIARFYESPSLADPWPADLDQRRAGDNRGRSSLPVQIRTRQVARQHRRDQQSNGEANTERHNPSSSEKARGGSPERWLASKSVERTDHDR